MEFSSSSRNGSVIENDGPNYEVNVNVRVLTKNPKISKHVEGHRGILTKEFDSTVSTLSTCKDSYREPQKNNVRQKGKRLEMLERHLYQQISNEVKQEFNPPPPKVDYTSTTKKDFSKDFQPIEQPPTMHHDVNSDQPLTFWNHNLNSIHGVSQIQTNDTPFKKNTAFSTPIDEYKDAPKPGEGWHY
ncbi:sperm-associated antigen 8-like [Rhopilema esculentum]|uniref:sperm-associated antigen 8-like n=1 Tax=Rhopilema esculentum TaxID=499914 RepID=UPI0031D52E74